MSLAVKPDGMVLSGPFAGGLGSDLVGSSTALLERGRFGPTFRDQHSGVTRAQRKTITHVLAAEIDPVNDLREFSREHNRFELIGMIVVRPTFWPAVQAFVE